MGIWVFAHLISMPKITLVPITYHLDVFVGQCPLVGLASLLPNLQNIGNKNTPNNHKARKYCTRVIKMGIFNNNIQWEKCTFGQISIQYVYKHIVWRLFSKDFLDLILPIESNNLN
jgi:hypothetical protein